MFDPMSTNPAERIDNIEALNAEERALAIELAELCNETATFEIEGGDTIFAYGRVANQQEADEITAPNVEIEYIARNHVSVTVCSSKHHKSVTTTDLERGRQWLNSAIASEFSVEALYVGADWLTNVWAHIRHEYTQAAA